MQIQDVGRNNTRGELTSMVFKIMMPHYTGAGAGKIFSADGEFQEDNAAELKDGACSSHK